eukprot:TRINITY_DN9266_c0_g1_i1.p1 TRINITY_DN9266_c0_g1~~TRINITY_DN9266_c0_g1_i1.p1  ORF type:complete len:223 (+),score=58.69 TRINITY_DN9266_c0_g1_i1:436-1104(+)
MDTRTEAIDADWNAKCQRHKAVSAQLDKLLLDYLLVEGFQDAAECFANEAQLEAESDLSAVAKRMNIRKAVEAGHIETAFDLVNDLNPAIFDANPSLYFQLRLQQLIELVREGKTAESLKFAQEELTPLTRDSDSQLAKVEEAISLLVFAKQDESLSGHLMQQAQRQHLASNINAAILKAEGKSSSSKLSNMVRLMDWSQERLKPHASFPEMDVTVMAEQQS